VTIDRWPERQWQTVVRPQGAGRAGSSIGVETLVWGLFTGLLALIFVLSVLRPFDHDELEAMQAAWKIYQGQQIYVDFFQMHLPLFYYVLQPLFLIYGDDLSILHAARAVMFVQLIAIYLVVYLLARELYDRRVAAVSVLFLASITIFAQAGIEIRPDVPMTLLCLLGVYLVYRYLRRRQQWLLVASGLSLAMAFLFLQKAAIPIALIGLLLLARMPQRTVGLHEVLVFGVGMLAVLVPYPVYLVLDGSFEDFFFFGFVFPPAFYDTMGAFDLNVILGTLLGIVANNGIILLLYVYTAIFVSKTREQWEVCGLGAALLIAMVGMTGVYWKQYFMLGLPLVAITAAQGLVALLGDRRRLLPAALVVICLMPTLSYSWFLATRDRGEQMARLAYVHAVTDPDDYVYDGQMQFNLFRKDLDFFYYGAFKTVDAVEVMERLRGYERDWYAAIERYRPKIISDHRMDVDDPRIAKHYEPVPGHDGMYVLRGHGVAPVEHSEPQWSCLASHWSELSLPCKLALLIFR